MIERTETNYIVIHCAQTPNGSARYDIVKVRKWHVEERGWSDVGYHRVIPVSGEVQIGRDLELEGAHCPPVNDESVSVCMMGTDVFTVAQWDSLRDVVRELLERYPNAQVIGDRDKQPHKQCPGFDVGDWMRRGMVPRDESVLITR